MQPSEEVPQTPKSFQGTHPDSSSQSMYTHPSASNLEQVPSFSKLPPGAVSGPLFPAQQARLNPSASAADMASFQAQPSSPTSTKDSGNFERPRRSSSMTINASTVSALQPQHSPAQYAPDEQSLGLSRTTSSVTLDGEPRIFPGVVSRHRRRSSMRNSQIEDVGHRQTDSVVEERDADVGA